MLTSLASCSIPDALHAGQHTIVRRPAWGRRTPPSHMFKKDRPKDPRKVTAGQAAHRKRTAGLSKEEYRAFQQHCRERALAKHPTMQQRGAISANRAQLREWGQEEYIEQRKAAYQRCIELHGERIAKAAVRRAGLQRRLSRLEQPTPGEALLRATLHEFGFTLHLEHDPFEFLSWREDGIGRVLGLGDAFAEGQVGPFFCDVLLPVLRIAIEVEGGVHSLWRERDALHRAFLEAHGLTVLVLHDTDGARLDRATVRHQLSLLVLVLQTA